jgi:SAM-dependent methyltransferase
VANHNAEVIALDPSETALDVARRNLGEIRGAVIRFIQGGAEMLSQLVNPKPVDAVFFCNAIHLVPEKDHVLQEIQQTLREVLPEVDDEGAARPQEGIRHHAGQDACRSPPSFDRG